MLRLQKSMKKMLKWAGLNRVDNAVQDVSVFFNLTLLIVYWNTWVFFPYFRHHFKGEFFQLAVVVSPIIYTYSHGYK